MDKHRTEWFENLINKYGGSRIFINRALRVFLQQCAQGTTSDRDLDTMIEHITFNASFPEGFSEHDIDKALVSLKLLPSDSIDEIGCLLNVTLIKAYKTQLAKELSELKSKQKAILDNIRFLEKLSNVKDSY
jgi:hypothetical protein